MNFTGALGLDVSMVGSRYAMSGDWWRTNRTPFREGYVSESVDGQTPGTSARSPNKAAVSSNR